MEELNISAVLTGQTDAYCLVCEEAGEHAALQDHIELDTHRHSLEKHGLVEKLETIRKVPKGYYCQLCNVFIRSLARAKIHTMDPIHQNFKINGPMEWFNAMELVKKEDSVVAFGCLNIAMKAWNAIVKNTCFVCYADVEENELETHIKSSNHVINVIQALVERSGWFLYRSIDENIVQCLTCNLVVSAQTLDSHFNSKNHELLINTASNGRIKKQDVSHYDINKNIRILNYIILGNNLCFICNTSVDQSNVNAHINTYHHKNMLKLHKQWIESKKWVCDSGKTKAIPLVLNEKGDDKTGEPDDVIGRDKEDGGGAYKEHDAKIKILSLVKSQDELKVGKHGPNKETTKEMEAQSANIKDEIANDEDKENRKPGNNVREPTDDIEGYHSAAEYEMDIANGDEITDKLALGVGTKTEETKEVDAEIKIHNNIEAKNGENKDHKTAVAATITKDADLQNETKYLKPETEASMEEIQKAVEGCMKHFSIEGQTDKVNNNKEISNKNKAKKDDACSSVKNLVKSGSLNEEQTIHDYATEYNISYRPRGVTTCRTCDERVRSELDDIKAHVASLKHRRNYFKGSKITPNNYDTVRLGEYDKTILGHITALNCSMTINYKYCVSFLSHNALVEEDDELRCHLCSKTVSADQIMSHCKTDLHGRLLRDSRIITSLNKEYVREVRHGVYQCGHCNQMFQAWERLLEHLMSRSHARRRLASNKLLDYNMKLNFFKLIDESGHN